MDLIRTLNALNMTLCFGTIGRAYGVQFPDSERKCSTAHARWLKDSITKESWEIDEGIKMKDLITPAVLGLVLAFGAIFGVDAEVARQDRAEGREVTGCLFAVNCWQAGEQ